MSLELYQRIIILLEQATGNTWTPDKILSLKGFIDQRVEILNCEDVDAYFKLLKSSDEEMMNLISSYTVHHTYFFREYEHFKFLKEYILKKQEDIPLGAGFNIRVLSAGSSFGHEAYSVAFLFEKYIHRDDFTYEIEAFDIDQKCIDVAKNGVFHFKTLSKTPLELLDDNIIRGSDEIADFFKVKKNIIERCHFYKGNILKSDDHLRGKSYDIIFCRNTLIYFNEANCQSITQSLFSKLNPKGYLISGLSESLRFYTNEKQKNVGPCIYSQDLSSDRERKLEVKKKRVVCIDDSPVVIKLLKRILKDSSYEVVGEASNGVEAVDVVNSTKADIITLDLHMPMLDGVGYLKRNFTQDHPPVLVVSSVTRDNKELAQKAISLGAYDYIEKPTLQNFENCRDELLLKLDLASHRKKSHFDNLLEMKDDSQRNGSTGLCLVFLDDQKKNSLEVSKLCPTIYIGGENSLNLEVVTDLKSLKNKSYYLDTLYSFFELDEVEKLRRLSFGFDRPPLKSEQRLISTIPNRYIVGIETLMEDSVHKSFFNDFCQLDSLMYELEYYLMNGVKIDAAS